MPQLGVGKNNLHGATAEHERRAHEDRIVQFFRHGERLGFVGRDPIGWLRDVELAQHRGEELAVFGDFDVLRRGADDVDAVPLQAQREVERGLSAELRDGAPALLPLVNVQHIFERQRLEKQFVARVVIGRNGFRV